MADLRKRCPQCKRQFRPRKGTRRTYCEECRPPRERNLAPVDDLPTPTDGPGRIEGRLLLDLEAGGRRDTVEAEVALRLAREMDSGKVTGTQLASLAPKLRESRAEALRGVQLEQGRLDDIAARRLAKAQAAGA